MPKKLVVLSYDALQGGDLDKLKNMPNFSKILPGAAVVRNVREVYPTLTYPIHTTLITGVYPDVHGIMHNQQPSIEPENPDFSIMGSDWYWHKKHIKVPTLADAVFERGGSVATVLWPVTAGEKRGWNVPEIWPQKMERFREVYEDASSANAFEAYYEPFVARYNWKDHGTDDMVYYSAEIALDILRSQKPDLLLAHITHLDHTRHVYGTKGREVDDCLRQLDILAGRFIQAARDAGTLEDTNFVILGDHGQIDIREIFHMNLLLRERGLIRTDAYDNVIDYDAYCFTAGFSAHIMLRDPDDGELRQKVRELLSEWHAAYPKHIEAVYDAAEVRRSERLAGEFSFVVEGADGVLISGDMDAKYLFDSSSPRYEHFKAMHGHHPDKGEKPPFIAFGPDVVPGYRQDSARMIDVAPTLAALIGANMPQMEGSALPLQKPPLQ